MTENLLHIKLEYEENLKGKGDILYIESRLLKVVRAMRNFHEIKEEELILKQILAKKIKDLSLSLKNLKLILPKQEIPRKFLKEENNPKETISFKKEKITKEEGDLEEQLREINEKLKLMK